MIAINMDEPANSNQGAARQYVTEGDGIVIPEHHKLVNTIVSENYSRVTMEINVNTVL